MKRLRHTLIYSLVLGALFLLSSERVSASHVMGGDITYTCLGNNQYSFQLRLFRDCNGATLGNTATITFSHPACGNQNATLQLLQGYPQVITPLCPGQPDVCLGGNGTYGVEEYVYKGVITLPACFANRTGINVSWSLCCRNNAITTLTNPGTTYLNSLMDTQTQPCNNSPDFLNSPIAFFCVGEQVNYNHGVVDQENDSLRFSLVNCKDAGASVPAYAGSFSGLNPLQTTGGMLIDPATGGLTFTPSVQQVGIVCVLVEEFRNGVKIGEVFREMQFTIVQCNNDLPVASGVDGTADISGVTGVRTLTVCADDTIQFTINTYDRNIADNVLNGIPDSVILTWNQGITGASFVSDGARQPTGTFFWVPDNSDVGNNLFTVNVRDQGCPISGVNIYSFLIKVDERPPVNAGAPQITCSPGEPVQLNALFNTTTGVSATHVWTPAGSLSNGNIQSPVATPMTTTTYNVFTTYNNGCTSRDSVLIEVTNGIQLPPLNDTTICQGAVQLDATIAIPPGGGGLSFVNDTVKLVPDNDPVGIRSYIQTTGVSPAAITATSIDSVCINIDHFITADLDVYLIAPNGVQMELTTDNGGGTGFNYTGTCFSPTAPTLITAGTPPFTGLFRPEGNFNTLNGGQSNGTWQLLVIDDNAFLGGQLNEWSIHFSDPNQINYSWTPTTNLSCSNCPDPIVNTNNTTTYTVIATNQNGCADTAAVTITVEDTLQAPIINCAAISPNSLTFCWGAVAGAASYEVNVDNAGWVPANGVGGLCHTVNNLAVTQTVTIQVRGVANCPNATILVGTQSCTTAPCTVAGTLASSTDVSCFGGNDGAITVTATGGYPSYQFSLDGGATTFPTGTFTGLTAGNYTVTVIDSFACTDVVNVTINEPTDIVLTTSGTDASCFGNTDGTAAVQATGGTGTYSYTWSNTGTTSALTGLGAGIYSVTVSDANGCIDTASFQVNEPDTLMLSAVTTDVSCNGAADGEITVTPTGGNGGNTFAWTGSASTSAIASNLSGGTYSVTVTDVNGCTATLTDSIAENTAIVLASDSIPALCNTSADGSAIVIANGGAGGFQYLWSANANAQTTATATNLTAGSYTVQVTDADGCSEVITVTVTSPTALTATMSQTPVFCHNTTDGTATISVAGGVGSYTYQWANSSDTTATADSLAVGFQAVTVTDANGCQLVDSIAVTGPTPISITLTPSASSCFGVADGAIAANVSGGAGGFSYAWSNGAITPNLTGVLGGAYTLIVTDANGCVDSAATLVSEPLSLTISLDSTDVSCFNGSDGTATVNVNGGTQPYNYQWQPSGQVTATATGLSAGFHAVTVSDVNGCSAVDSIFVNQPATGVSTTMSMTPLVCNGDASGTATVVATGGSGNYTYTWSTNPVQTNATATGLQAGNYTVTVTDVNGCTYTDNITVTEPTAVQASATSTPASCNGYDDGTATVVATGGMGGYTYAWNTTPAQTDTTAVNLTAGTYTVTVTDANGCQTTTSVTVNEPTGMTLTMGMNPVSCHSGSDGIASVSVTGGTGNYTYAWSSFVGNSSTATGLSAGFHTVTVTDANGCIKVDSIEVTEPDTLLVALSNTNVSCFGGSDGTATAVPTGGVGGYNYTWNTTPPQNTPVATNLPAGTFAVTLTDLNGCVAVDSITITQPASGVSTTISSSPVSCNGGNDGTATVVATGGAGNYTYLWTNNQTTATATGLVAGTYTVTVTDGNGCFVTDQVTVGEPSAITLIAAQTSASCFNGNDGTATVAASGGVPGTNNTYTYAWNTTPVQTTATATGLNGGQSYSVTVTDANGCTAITSITIGQPTPVQLTTTQTNVSCKNFSDGTATVNAGGGTPGYTYQWDFQAGSQTAATATGLAAGTYFVTVTDFNGCTAATSVTITEPSQLAISSTQVDVACKFEATGSVQLFAAGGTPQYSFQWDSAAGNSTFATVDGLAAGTYTVTMTDANGCQVTETVTIAEPAKELDAAFNVGDVSCFGERDGSLEVLATGGVVPYQYQVGNRTYSNASDIVGLTAGTYQVNVRDDNGCVFTDTITIIEPDQLIVDAGADLEVEYGDAVQLTTAVTNGVEPFLYSWLPADSSLSCFTCPAPLASPEVDAFYEVEVIDANGCVAYDEVAVRVFKVREVFIATGFTPNGDNVNDFLFVQGGEQSMRVVEFRVFDRWGEQVFAAFDTPLNSPNEGWDGTLRGQPMNPGIFGWVVVVEFSDGERATYKGNTTLIR